MKILENVLKSIIRKVIKVDNLNWDINQILEPTHGAFRGTPMDREYYSKGFSKQLMYPETISTRSKWDQ